MNLVPVHPFPARMAPSIAMKELSRPKRKPLRLLDPMSGSGTSLVVGRYYGHSVYGFDTDPLALLISKVWCSDINEISITNSVTKVLAIARARYGSIKQSGAYPLDSDDKTKEFIRYWFDATNRKQLRALADAINETQKSSVRNVLWCAFSRLIIAKKYGASWAMDLSHSRPHKVLDKPLLRPISGFEKAVKTIVKNIHFKKQNNTVPKAFIKTGDARSLPLPDSSIDVVITSPPYLNAIDYLRCSKFSLVWMGYQIPYIRKLRSDNIGTEASRVENREESHIEKTVSAMGDIEKLPEKNKKLLTRYVVDMDKVMGEISRVLVPSGRAIIVIGDSTMRGVFIKNSKAIAYLGKQYGLQTKSFRKREIPSNRRYLPPPSSLGSGASFQARMREEVVITMVAD